MAARPKNGSWMADFMVAGERRREFGFSTKTEAEAWELDARAALMRGLPLPPGPLKLAKAVKASIGELVDHVAAVHWTSRKAGETLTRPAKTFAQWCGAATPVAECLTTMKLGEYVQHLQAMSLSGSTINRHLAALSVVAKYAMALNYIPAKPMFPRQKEAEGRIRWFTPEEEDTILKTLAIWGMHDARDLFIFLVDTGARLGEALKLDWESIDASGRLVTFWETKAGNHRTLVMTMRVRDVIARRRAALPGSTGPFDGITRSYLKGLWARLRSHLAFLDESTVIHTFRHTCASRLVQRGVPLVRVKEWMGHKAIQTTLRYAHLSPKDMEEVVKVLEVG